MAVVPGEGAARETGTPSYALYPIMAKDASNDDATVDATRRIHFNSFEGKAPCEANVNPKFSDWERNQTAAHCLDF